jgi:SPP1 family predicted phage head-tail adaptor
MQGGKLDRRVTVQSFTETENDFGEITQTWADAQTLWAGVSYGTGKERREAAQDQSALRATFFVRSSTFTRAITPGANRLTFDGLTWDIESAVPSVKRGEHVQITATARTS